MLIGAVASDEPDLARVGAAVLVVTMLGALFAHLGVRDSLAQVAPAAVLGVLAVVTVVVAGKDGVSIRSGRVAVRRGEP